MAHTELPSNPLRKRRKGATRLSCAECRRLKLRCDRGIPCSSCVKRGCGAICPDGSLTTGQGNRFVLASTQELHEKISELANRVRQLEDALRSSHAQLSPDQHHLLSEELLRIKAPLQREPPPHKSPTSAQLKDEEHNPDVVDAFGSLSIVSGREKYYGQGSNSWLFLENESPEDQDQDDRLERLLTILPPEILKRASALPISPDPTKGDIIDLQAFCYYLPPADKALALRSTFYSHAAWMYNPLSSDLFDSQVYSQFYGANESSSSLSESLIYHRLSLMFMVLAIGSLMDTSLEAYNLEAEKYHQLAKAALFHFSLFGEPTISAIQALFLMTIYLFLSDRHGTNSGARWSLNGVAVKLAQSIGLHRDSGRWGVDAAETQTRRELFWELFTYDSWQCNTFGRPPSFALVHVDCKMPFEADASDDQSFHAWKHRFTSECMVLLHDQAFAARMPTYANILQIDRKMRAFPVPPILQVPGFGSSEPRPGGFPESVMLTLQRHIVLALRETNLLYLHRSFFARAISDHPKDPLGSPYGTSVIAAYRSAGSLVALMRNLHSQLKEPSERIWFLWAHMFSCAIVLGSIVTRCPSMSIAPSALQQLDSACDLFSVAAHGFRANRVLSIMVRLREKAHFSLEEFKEGRGSPVTHYTIPSSTESNSPIQGDDELSVLGGKTRLVKKEPNSPRLSNSGWSPPSVNPIIPLPLSPSTQGQWDPNILEYLHTFVPQPWEEQCPQHGSSPYEDISPVSAFGMASSPTFHSATTFMGSQGQPQPQVQQQTQHPFSQSQSSHLVQQQQLNMMGSTSASAASGSSFPQYFAVYDYGTPMNGVMNGNVDGHGMNGYSSVPADSSVHRRRGSGGSDSNGNNMQAAWHDFVAAGGYM